MALGAFSCSSPMESEEVDFSPLTGREFYRERPASTLHFDAPDYWLRYYEEGVEVRVVHGVYEVYRDGERYRIRGTVLETLYGGTITDVYAPFDEELLLGERSIAIGADTWREE